MALDFYKIEKVTSLPRRLETGQIQQIERDEEIKFILIGIAISGIITLAALLIP